MKKDTFKRISMSEGAIAASRKLDKALGGKGVEITIGSSEEGGIQSYFSNKLPSLKIQTANALREIEVEVSSVEQENNELLHYLVRKTVES